MKNNWKIRILGMSEFFAMTIMMCAITLVVYYISYRFSLLNPQLNFYHIAIVAGATGGFWGFGMTVAYDFVKDLRNHKICMNRSFRFHLRRQLLQIGISIAITVIMGFIIAFR